MALQSGCVIDATPIAVDFWKPTKASEVYLYFLTHLHGDHTEGLTSSWRFPIYTSTINAQLLKKRLKLPNSVFRELEIGSSYIVPLDEGKKNTMTVTVYDANHVPGAVMFLFQGYFGNILYCGNMRWNPDLLNDSLLRDVIQNRELDVLYLDNTYSAPYCLHPSREEATQQILKIIEAYPDHEIKIGISKIGLEALLEDIAKKCGERIFVTQERFEELEIMKRLDVFTTDPDQSRIHTVNEKEITVALHKQWNDKCHTITLIPTALFVGWKNAPYSTQGSNGIHVVPYSDHSSYPELLDMVTKLAPHQIIPIVTYWSKSGWWSDPSVPDQSIKGDMTVYSHLLTSPPPHPVIIPEEVIDEMSKKGPRLLDTQAQFCYHRKGLSPRRHRVRIGSSIGTYASSPLRSESLPRTPTSFRTIHSDRSDCSTPRRLTNIASPTESPISHKRKPHTLSQVFRRNLKRRLETVGNEGENSHVSTTSIDSSLVSTARLSNQGQRRLYTVVESEEEINDMSETAPHTSAVHMSSSEGTHTTPMSKSSKTHAVNTTTMYMSHSQTHTSDANKDTRIRSENEWKTTKGIVRKRKKDIQQGGEEISDHLRSLTRKQTKQKGMKTRIHLKKKTKSQNLMAKRMNVLLSETGKLFEQKLEEMDSRRKVSIEDEMKCLANDTKLLLEAVTCLDSLL